jgi:hypothetical protein
LLTKRIIACSYYILASIAMQIHKPHLTTYSYDADKYYYYCAEHDEAPRLCTDSGEEFDNLSKYRVALFDSLGIDSISAAITRPESMMLGTPYSCLSQYIKEMLLVSNNNAFNPVYDFLRAVWLSGAAP